jgi:biotin carboxyl carrier protein
MVPGKAVNLRVRPVQSADLCFPCDGIISDQRSPLLGQSVIPWSLKSIIDNITPETTPWELWSVPQSEGLLLCALRNESAKAELTRTQIVRDTAKQTTFSMPVLTEVVKFFGDDGPPGSSMVDLLELLLETNELEYTKLHSAYKKYKMTDVVRSVKSDTKSTDLITDPTGSITGSELKSHTDTTGTSYRVPETENMSKYLRSQISLKQEYLAAIRMREMCKSDFRYDLLSTQLRAMDQDIRQLQIAYLDTIMIAPFPGIVTGVFQNVGDFVRAGQPVLRVENDETVYLVGTIKCRGLVRLNSKVIVKTTLFDAPEGSPTEISGTVSSVRGHDSVDEQWDVLILCQNRTEGGDPILPLNYNFNFESTTLEITPV